MIAAILFLTNISKLPVNKRKEPPVVLAPITGTPLAEPTQRKTCVEAPDDTTNTSRLSGCSLSVKHFPGGYFCFFIRRFHLFFPQILHFRSVSGPKRSFAAVLVSDFIILCRGRLAPPHKRQ
jgi:hypothetical protein